MRAFGLYFQYNEMGGNCTFFRGKIFSMCIGKNNRDLYNRDCKRLL